MIDKSDMHLRGTAIAPQIQPVQDTILWAFDLESSAVRLAACQQ